MIPVIWLLPALLVTVLAIDRSSGPGKEGEPSLPPPLPPPEPEGYGDLKPRQLEARQQPERRARRRTPAGTETDWWDDLVVPEHRSPSRMEMRDERDRRPRSTMGDRMGSHPGRLANVMQLPLSQATEAARLRFLKGPVRSVTEGSGAIIVWIDPTSTDALLVPPTYLGWPVQIREASSGPEHPRGKPATFGQRNPP